MFIPISCTVYNKNSYVALVSRHAEDAMSCAVSEVKALPEYAESGEVSLAKKIHFILQMTWFNFHQWVITDARHDSTANAYHTTVPCLSGRYLFYLFVGLCHLVCIYSCHSTHRIVGISTISRTVHSVAQTRELACTKIVLPQVIDRGKC